MNFELDADDLALVEATRAFCDGLFPAKALRELEVEGGVRRALWSELAGTGVFGLRLPEKRGGADLGMSAAVLVFEELGRALVPGPVVATHLAADLVDGAASGACVVGAVEAARDPLLIEHLGSLDVVLVVGTEGIVAVPAQVVATVAEAVDAPFDPLTPVSWVSAGLGAVIGSGTEVAGAEEAVTFADRWRALSAAFACGMARRTVDLAVDYARQREQFGRPIGSFQAVKHLLADAVTRAEVARASVHAAGVLLDDAHDGAVPRSEACQAVAAAKLLACDAAVANARTCIQVHGGMGFTWEVEAHLYLKRAVVLSSSFGTSAELEAELADLHDDRSQDGRSGGSGPEAGGMRD